MSQDDVREVDRTKTSKKRRFDQRDWNLISEYMLDTLSQRKKDRRDREKVWKEIDRQVEMIPDVSHKLNADGTPNKDKAWLPEVELPLQAQTLEILTADARRMMFPDSGPWYESHAALTDEYLEKVDFQSLITGDRNEVPTRIDQDAANKLVTGAIDHWHRQYDFFGNIDQINAEAFKYGLGIGRGRTVSKRVFLNTAKGVVPLKQKVPVLVPVSVKNTYPDDSMHRLMNEGQWIGPSVLREWTQLLSDVVLAATRGSKDPEDENGGWMPSNLSAIEPNDHGTVNIVEMEGDFIVPRKSTSDIYIPNAVATIVQGKKGKKSVNQVIRFRFRDLPFSSYVFFPYHVEDMECAYPSSPLMKGRPIQKSAVNMLSRLIEAGALHTQPPLSYSPDDRYFSVEGGPKVFPGATWPTSDGVTAHVIGDPSALFGVYVGMLQQYADVTGVNAPRLGQQTVSHTTAFAKEAELQRGTIRTVDYVRSTLKGALTQWLYMAYAMGRDSMKKQSIFIDAYHGFVDLEKSSLPERVAFEVHGSGGPQEQQLAQQQKLQSMQLALQLDAQNQQLGGQQQLDMANIIDQVLREGGWKDVDVLLNSEAPLQEQRQPLAGLGILQEQLGG